MRLNITHITENPIALVSTILAIIGWILSFIGACIIKRAGVFWWIVIYELLLLSGILFSIFKQVFHHHQLSFLVFLGVSIALLTSAISGLLNLDLTGYQIAGTGSVILIVMQFFWLILFGSTEDSAVFQYFYAHHAPQTIKEKKIALSVVPEEQEEHVHTEKIFATALHPYRANPEDPDELSFTKGEVLEMLDQRGNWWRAKKSDGTIGIVPSNYF